MSDIIKNKIEAILKKIDSSFEYSDNLNLRSDLNLDSLDVIEFLFEVESQLNVKIPEEDIDEKGLLILGNLLKYVLEKLDESG